jgi:hypothetical protein
MNNSQSSFLQASLNFKKGHFFMASHLLQKVGSGGPTIAETGAGSHALAF